MSLVAILIALNGLVALLMVLGLRPGHKNTSLVDNFQTSGHFGFFATFALVVALAAAWVHPWLAARHGWRGAIGLAAAIGAGGLLEFAQKFIPRREPSWNDLLFDTLGGAAGIALFMAVHYRRSVTWAGRLLGGTALIVFVGLIVFGATPFVSCAVDYYRRDAAQPDLLPLQQSWSKRFLWIDDSVSFHGDRLPPDWPDDAGRQAGLFRIRPTKRFRGFGIKEIYPDWSDQESFAFDLYNPMLKPLKFGIRIHDFQHNEDYYDRYNRVLDIQPGFQTIRIAIAEVAQAPRGRRMNLKHIDSVKLFLVEPEEPVQIYAGNFRLE